jgi:DeoR/GlpR family transcriptional regulator of sugar metabolism
MSCLDDIKTSPENSCNVFERNLDAFDNIVHFRAMSSIITEEAMLTTHRKQQILALLKRNGQVIAKEVSQKMGVSEDTIRRDLRELAQEGLLQRVHGGALPASPAMADFAGRELLTPEGKTAIGRAAAAMVQPGQVVMLDGGTTARQVARHLPRDLKATIVTHSPTIALELVNHPDIEVILIGGRMFKHSVVAVGATAIEAIGLIHADTYFMGVTGVHPKTGLTTGDFEEAAVKRAMSRAAAETIVLASSEKLNAASPYAVVSLDEISGIITEQEADEALTRPYEQLNITVMRV